MDNFLQAWQTGQPFVVPSTLRGRILHGQKPEDFFTLSDSPNRLLVMMMGADGLQALLGKSGFEMLVLLGSKPEYIVEKLRQGHTFKLAVFERGGNLPATWNNVARLVTILYPETLLAFSRHIRALKVTPFEEWQRQLDFSFLEVQLQGEIDPRFMTYDRFLKSGRSVLDLRRFLYHMVHLNDLFSGDGFTKTFTGEKGVREFLVINQPLLQLGKYRLVELNLSLPR